MLIRGLGAIALIIIGRVGECLDSRENDRILGSYWGVTRELLGSYCGVTMGLLGCYYGVTRGLLGGL